MKIPTECKLEKVASTGPSRYEINQIRYEKDNDRTVAIATNGKAMAVVTAESEETDKDDSVLIPVGALKLSRKNGTKGQININEKTISVSQPDGETVYPKPEGTFPKWQEVIPKYDTQKTREVSIDAQLLYDLAQALGTNEIKLTIPENSFDSILVKTLNGNYGVIMPMKSYD